MKRVATHIILAVVALITLSGCTHNDGDIGHWFGLWHLDSIEVDGTPAADYDGDIYFMFQSKVFCVRCVDEFNHGYVESFARWQESDDHHSMTLSFVDNRFSPTVLPLIPLELVTTFSVVTLNEKDMILKHTHSETGLTYTYYFTRWE